MNIAGLRVRITIQRNETVTDRYANHRSVWTDHFSCWASASKGAKNTDESAAAGTTTQEDRLDFTVRWSSETAAVDTKRYRIVLDGKPYNIVSIDEQGFRRKSRVFTAELTER